ncbi:hypothetical protein CAPTEDRAFT_202967 [Capitella teleta]|uniref:Uncharacterized protein n=1 Tax=Capitella teleta TaxID=283909 RepID=R7TNF9_CAPTE|nr:hypothetical protein CAPTEDRAFT_202967 [Capitella teleta]|eukprot:ELT95082.1 hypothetical protein CAPTEDRAFT_202967 [Capitella teleta]
MEPSKQWRQQLRQWRCKQLRPIARIWHAILPETPPTYWWKCGHNTVTNTKCPSLRYLNLYNLLQQDKFAFWDAKSGSDKLGSDSASARSYGSQRSFGAGSSSYKPYDSGTRSGTSGVYSSGSGGYDSSSLRRATSVDRSLSYANTNRGNVASLSNKFGSSSYDTGRGYTSDAESTRSYGSSYSRPSSSTYGSSRNTSPPRSSSRIGTDYSRSSTRDYSSSSKPSKSYGSSTDYGSSATKKDYGTSYSSGSTYTPSTPASRLRNTDYNLTPFSSRRTAKASDINLTPFSTRHTRASSVLDTSSTTKPYERSSSGSSMTSRQPSVSRQTSVDRTVSRQNSEEVKKKQKEEEEEKEREKEKLSKQRRRIQYDDSSDSEKEPDGKKDPNFRYLTSRATSPMDPDRDAMEMRQMRRKSERRFIARTKTKKYPVKEKNRKRRLKNIHIQVNTEELDKFTGRFRHEKNKYAKYAKPLETRDKRPSYTSQSSTRSSSRSQLDSDRSSKIPSQSSIETPVTPPAQHSKEPRKLTEKLDKFNHKTGEAQDSKPVPKQSGFKPKSRSATFSLSHDEIESPRRSRTTQEDTEDESVFEDDIPAAQTSFVNKHERDKTKRVRVKKLEPKVAALTSENLSLKDSIDKVRNWKKQLSSDGILDEPAVYAQGEHKKKKVLKKQESKDSTGSGETLKQKSRKSSREGLLSPPSEPEIPEIDIQDADKKFKKKKMYSGVPEFPIEDNFDRLKPTANRGKKTLNRSSSPYDNDESKPSKLANDKNKQNNKDAPVVVIDHLVTSDSDATEVMSQTPSESMMDYGDESSIVTSDEDFGSLQKGQSTMSINSMDTNATYSLPRKGGKFPAMSMDSLASSVSSLPDVVQSSERGGQWSRVMDIDSLLGFTETEDDFEEDEFDSGSDFSCDDKSWDRKSKSWDRKTQGSQLDLNLSPVHEESSPFKRKASCDLIDDHRDKTPVNDHYDDQYDHHDVHEDYIFIGQHKDIDEVFGEEDTQELKKFVPQTPKTPLTPSSPLLSLKLPETPTDGGSADSLMDTPVPETPDVPLAPMPAFFPSSPTKLLEPQRLAKSQDHINRNDATPSPKPLSKVKKSKTSKSGRKTKSAAANLDDLDSLLDTISTSSSMKRSKKKETDTTVDAFDLFSKDFKEELIAEVEKTAPPAETLLDIDVVDDAGQHPLGIAVGKLIDISSDSNGENKDLTAIKTPPAKKFYPKNYSEQAIKEALEVLDKQEHITIQDLLTICQKEKIVQPPWILDEEDKYFTGYESLTELLEDLSVDVKKIWMHPNWTH